MAALPRPLEDGLVDLYTLLVLRRGEATTREDVHDAWAVWQSREQPGHRSLLPLDELSEDVQASDDPYVEAIHQASGNVNGPPKRAVDGEGWPYRS